MCLPSVTGSESEVNCELFNVIYELLKEILIAFKSRADAGAGEKLALGILPVICQIYGDMIHALIGVRARKPQVGDEAETRTASKSLPVHICAQNMDRFATLLIETYKAVDSTAAGKHVTKTRSHDTGDSLMIHLPHLIARVVVDLARVSARDETGSDPIVREYLQEALHRLLGVVSRDRSIIELMCARLLPTTTGSRAGGYRETQDAGAAELFKHLYSRFDKYFRYKGTV